MFRVKNGIAFMHSAVKQKKDHLAIQAKREADSAAAILNNTRGDQNSSTAGLVIAAIIAAGLLIIWINAKFPGFFNSIGDRIKDLLNLK